MLNIRHFRNGIEVGTIAGTEVTADKTIQAVITAIEERNENNVKPTGTDEVART